MPLRKARFELFSSLNSAGSSTIFAFFETRRTTVSRQGKPCPSFEVTTTSTSARRFIRATEWAWRTVGPK